MMRLVVGPEKAHAARSTLQVKGVARPFMALRSSSDRASGHPVSKSYDLRPRPSLRGGTGGAKPRWDGTS